jgi:hypothetical protein
MQFSGSVVISQAVVIHFKRALHHLLELQLVCKEVGSISRFRALGGSVGIGNGRASMRRISNLGLSLLTFRFNPL